MRAAVLDSFAVLAFLFKEHGWQVVQDLLEELADAGETASVAAPNWAEVRYVVERKAGMGRWPEASSKLLGLPIEVVSADKAMAEVAGQFKASGGMSLADCFAAALASQMKARLYTGDPEFHQVEKDINIVWL